MADSDSEALSSRKEYAMNYFTEEESFNLALRGVFTVTDLITPDSVQLLCQSILSSINDETETITLLISSAGGNVEGVLCFADFAQLFGEVQFQGIAVGECGSAAFSLLQCCDARLSLPHCQFYVHQMHSSLHVTYDGTELQQVKSMLAEGRKTHDFLIDMVCKRAGIRRSQWLKLADEGERYGIKWTAKDFLELGLIDGIIEKFPLY